MAGKVLLITLKNISKVRYYRHVKDALRTVIKYPLQPVGVKLPHGIHQFLHAIFTAWRNKNAADDSTLKAFSCQLVENLHDALASIAHEQLPGDVSGHGF